MAPLINPQGWRLHREPGQTNCGDWLQRDAAWLLGLRPPLGQDQHKRVSENMLVANHGLFVAVALF